MLEKLDDKARKREGVETFSNWSFSSLFKIPKPVLRNSAIIVNSQIK